MARAHVILPEELMAELDRTVGRRRRSAFIESAIRDKLLRERQLQALRNPERLLVEEHPEWATPEAVSSWVRELRRLDLKQHPIRSELQADDDLSA